MVVPSHNIHI